MRNLTFFSIVIAIVGSLACTPSQKSASGFRLPDGDVERGNAAFVALKFHDCHQVAGVDLPDSKAPSPVVLGGIVNYPRTDGQLVGLIIDPSRRAGPRYGRDAIEIQTLSHMAETSAGMTLKQLVDVVAFLQSSYDVRPTVGPYQF